MREGRAPWAVRVLDPCVRPGDGHPGSPRGAVGRWRQPSRRGCTTSLAPDEATTAEILAALADPAACDGGVV